MDFMKYENQAEAYNAVTLDEYVLQSLLRFGRFYLTRWQVDLICQNEKLLHANAGTGGMEILNKENFSKIKMYFPCFAEQQKIADCLSSLDEVIEKQKATLSAWEELKKGLLQQMFV